MSDSEEARFCGMVGRSQAMRRVFALVGALSAAATTVFIIGDTGTGKELVARAIHSHGPRCNAPFVPVNCAALPRELIESELFGHQRGAFSGAREDYKGLFRAADGGTIFLDEVTEMSLESQAKVLRVLQERVVRPVGSTVPKPVDVRVLASTNRDPMACVEAGSFRRDLYYRLAESTIFLPPLRERPEDIPLLIEHAVAEASRLDGSEVRQVTAKAREWLEAQLWPGNVRELLNVIRGAALYSRGGDIDVRDLPNASASRPSSNDATFSPHFPIPTLPEAERSVIAKALTASEGNRAAAARLLRLPRSTLYAKMQRYGLSKSPRLCIGEGPTRPRPHRQRPRKGHLRLVKPQ